MENHCCKLHVLGLGLAAGILWGASCFLLGLLAMGGYGAGFVRAVSTFYIGYGASFWGAVIGLIWGFVDFFIGGVILAWLYNIFAGSCCKKSKQCEMGGM